MPTDFSGNTCKDGLDGFRCVTACVENASQVTSMRPASSRLEDQLTQTNRKGLQTLTCTENKPNESLRRVIVRVIKLQQR